MSFPKLFFLFILLGIFCPSSAQPDSLLQTLQQIPAKYISNIDNKIDKYSNRISSKTEKVLTKLSRWENNIQSLLQKVNPEAADRLFGNQQTTFGTLLQKIKEGKTIVENYQATYNEYRDKLTSHLKYLQEQKDKVKKNLIEPIEKANEKLIILEEKIETSEAITQFIKERKKQLIDEAIKYIGKSKYLKKINKEAYYYVETLRNYKEIFSDPQKTEETVINLLNKIPAFQKFVQQHSQFGNLFVLPASFPMLPVGSSMPVVNGLASRALLQQYVQDNIPSINNLNLAQRIQAQLPDIKSQLDQFQHNINGTGNEALPDFTPNTQRTKTFKKRIEFGTELQFGRAVNYLPATTNIALKVGYKLNDKSSVGIGVNYIMGLGNGWNNIRISHQGLGFRTYLKWKIIKGLDIQGGSEWNYMLQFNSIAQLKNINAWQQSALLGLSKNYAIGKKLKGNIQLLYDFLYNNYLPVKKPFIVRFGYHL